MPTRPESDGPPPLFFIPAPSRTNRRDGWTEQRQRDFVAAVQRCGCSAAAARQVGMTVRSAYRLAERPGGESFAGAWDEALVQGKEATRDNVIDRAMHGAWVPIVRRGRTVRMEFRYFDKLAISVLAGRDRDLGWEQHRRAQFRLWARQDREKREREAELEQACRRAEERVRREAEARHRPRGEPRIVRL